MYEGRSRTVDRKEWLCRLEVEGALCHCHGHAAQIGGLLAGYTSCDHNDGRKTSYRTIRCRWNGPGCYAARHPPCPPTGRIHHSRCLHPGHHNGILHYLGPLLGTQGQAKGAETRHGDATYGSDQRACHLEQPSIQRSQGRCQEGSAGHGQS